jgi:class 3 adenylate cyclase/Tfp pilus assembly protein PilF
MAEERVERRLAAILAADVVGYSRLMGANEEATLAEMKRHLRELVDPRITEHRGRIVKTTGDGVLVEFASVVDAVRCAVDIQREMADRNVGVPAERRIEFRIGLNVGDIIIDGTDIYGDGVNIAARLEALAEPGGICASRVVRDQVRDKLDFSFEDMGEQQVKNIVRPVRAHRILLGPTAVEPTGAAAPAAQAPQQKPSIAVLPFAWHIRRFTQDDLVEARRLLDEAIALDPANAMAFSDLAFARHFEAVFGWGDGPSESHARLGEAARKAVAIDDGDAAAHTALAIYELFSGRHEEARRRLRRALDLDPNSVFALGCLGTAEAFGGNYDATLPHCDEAIRLSPRDPLLVCWHLCKGWAALSAERYEEAVEFTTRAADANPEFPDIYVVLAAANGQLGRTEAARTAPDQLLRRMPALTAGDERLDRPFARAADRERFLEGLRKAGMPA